MFIVHIMKLLKIEEFYKSELFVAGGEKHCCDHFLNFGYS